MPKVKTEAQERAKLRANEQRKLEHAVGVIDALIKQHMNSDYAERVNQDLYGIQVQLTMLIKNQHIKDERYKEYKAKFPTEGY